MQLALRKFGIKILPFFAIASFLVFLYPDVVFFGKTLQASESASGVMPSGQYGYPLENKISGVSSKDPGASAWQYVPLFEFSLQEYQKGKFPLWNPYAGLGAPLAAQMQSSGFFIPQVLIAALQGFDFHWDFYFLLRLFFAGLFTYLFCRKIELSKFASLFASLLFMGNGYFLFFSNMAHLNVEILLPFFLWAIESFRQKKTWIGFLLVALSTHLLITGGFPKATFFAFVFGGLYLLVRFFQDRDRKHWLFSSLLAIVLGIGISAFLLFPFFEYFAQSAHIHTSSLSRELTAYPWRTIVTLFFPRFFGNLSETWAQGFVSAPFISLLAWPLAIFAFYKRKPKHKNRSLIIFFAVVAVFYLLKAFGFPLLHWVQNLPFLKLLNFHKYLFVEFAFSMAILAAMGFEKLMENKRFQKLLHSIPEIALFLILIVFLLGESASAYWFSRNNRYEPFTKAPYVEFLEKEAKAKGPFRIFSPDLYLFPNISSVYGISDIRANDALYPDSYYNFIKRNIAPEIYDRFSGEEKKFLAFENPLWNLLNIRYFILSPNSDLRLPENFKRVYAGTDTFLFENTKVRKRAFFTDSSGNLSSGDVTFSAYEPQKMSMKVRAEKEGYLIVSDIFYPGFHASVDNKRTKILNASELFPTLDLPVRALRIEPGNHEVMIEYKAPTFRIGALLSLLILVLTGICAKLLKEGRLFVWEK